VLQLQDSIYLRGKGAPTTCAWRAVGLVVLILTAWLFLDARCLRRLSRLVGELGSARDSGTEALEAALVSDARREDELGSCPGHGQAAVAGAARRDRPAPAGADFRSLAESTGVGIFVLRDQIVYATRSPSC